MSTVQILRALLKQRLPADDDEEIFELFERTTAEYEEEFCGLKEENERQRKLLEAVLSSDNKTDVQSLLVKEASTEHQEWTCCLGQWDQEHHHIKNQEEELWKSEEREHVQVLGADTTTCVNDEKRQSSNCHPPQTEENGEVELLASSSAEQIKTESNEEDWGGSELTMKLEQDSYSHAHIDMISHSAHPESEVRDIELEKTREPRLFSLKNKKIPIYDRRCNDSVKLFSNKYGQMINKRTHTSEKPFNFSLFEETFNQNSNPKKLVTDTGGKPFSCSDCGKAFCQRYQLKKHMICHTGEKPFSCTECGKAFSRKGNLKDHMIFHTEDKPFSCSECDKMFRMKVHLKTHMRTHTGEKPFSCSECGKTFSRNICLKTHMIIHTGEKPLSCSECDKTFIKNRDLKTHVMTHTGEKPFSCSECGKTFSQSITLKNHMMIHTGEKPFHCSECSKTFSRKSDMKTHMIIHTGVKRFSCSECGKTFGQNIALKTHLIIHTGEKPFNCSECGKTFNLKGNLKRHMVTHTAK